MVEPVKIDSTVTPVIPQTAMSNWKPKPTARNSRWRDYLTDEERQILKAIDAAKRHWQKLNIQRPTIVNRAIKRAANATARKE